MPSAKDNLIDAAGRMVDYLRISVTDRCNERCAYCLPENFHEWLPRGEILSYEEILLIARIAASMGVKKFRVTGGEPLVRRDIVYFIERLCSLPGVEQVHLTTNGTRLSELAKPLYRAGLRSLNISLDAMNAEVYHAITGGNLDQVLAGLTKAKEADFRSIKLNTVLMRGKNEDQILPLIDFAEQRGLVLRFIELMPVSLTEMLDESNFLPLAEVRNLLQENDTLDPVTERLGSGPARYFRLRKKGVTVGFIGAMTNLHFCEQCNKMRLTCEGKLRPCLGNHLETDLKPALRPTPSEERLKTLIRKTLSEKPDAHIFRENYRPQRVMTAIGG